MRLLEYKNKLMRGDENYVGLRFSKMIISLRFVGQIDDRIGEAKIRRSKPSSPNSIRVVFRIFFCNVIDYFCSMSNIQVGVPGYGIFVETQFLFLLSAVSGV